MLKKLGKEKTVKLNPNFRLKYGTVDALNFKAIYLQMESWVQPINNEVDHKKSVSYLKNIAYNVIYNTINRNLFSDRFIIDLDLRTSGMNVDRRSFMCLEVTLYVKDDTQFKSSKITNQSIELLNEMTLKLENNNFSFKTTKK